jgi:myosin-5
MESFGNAKTLRNDNSSRFGKFTCLQFEKASGLLVGAACQTYLLEKTRVVQQGDGERNYHIFYQLLHSGKRAEVEELTKDGLNYVKGGHQTIEGRTDSERWMLTQTAMELVGMKEGELAALWGLLTAILNMGQVTFDSIDDGEGSKVSTTPVVQNHFAAAARFIGVDANMLETAICCHIIKAKDDEYNVQLNKNQANDVKDAFSKALYSGIFNWLVKRVNELLGAKNMTVDQIQTIAILDIFGFEHFKHNSFEQFCINYANEKLQQKFTQDVFKTVQIEYEFEGITWAHIAFSDNEDTLQLVEGRLGVIALLNEECTRGNSGSDRSFLNKLVSQATDHPNFEKARLKPNAFIVHHYAGSFVAS